MGHLGYVGVYTALKQLMDGCFHVLCFLSPISGANAEQIANILATYVPSFQRNDSRPLIPQWLHLLRPITNRGAENG